MVATDVAGRGIHIDGVTHVFNYQLPEDPDDYVHRIGRTGRAGATGASICFACEDDSFMIPEIEAETGVKLNCIHPEAELLEEPKSQTIKPQDSKLAESNSAEPKPQEFNPEGSVAENDSGSENATRQTQD